MFLGRIHVLTGEQLYKMCFTGFFLGGGGVSGCGLTWESNP